MFSYHQSRPTLQNFTLVITCARISSFPQISNLISVQVIVFDCAVNRFTNALVIYIVGITNSLNYNTIAILADDRVFKFDRMLDYHPRSTVNNIDRVISSKSIVTIVES